MQPVRRDPKLFWKLLRSLKQRAQIPTITSVVKMTGKFMVEKEELPEQKKRRMLRNEPWGVKWPSLALTRDSLNFRQVTLR
jgi:hypothetical protein